jgi:hypothetical protein
MNWDDGTGENNPHGPETLVFYRMAYDRHAIIIRYQGFEPRTHERRSYIPSVRSSH